MKSRPVKFVTRSGSDTFRPGPGCLKAVAVSSRYRRLLCILPVFFLLAAAWPSCSSGQPVSISCKGAGFDDGFPVESLRAVFRSVLAARLHGFGRCDLVLSGRAVACDIRFSLRRARLRLPSGELLADISGRIPVGNLLALLKSSLRWPESVTVKDLVFEVDCRGLAGGLAPSGLVRSVLALPSLGALQADLRFPGRTPARRRLALLFGKRGLILTSVAGKTTLKNRSEKGLFLFEGAMPSLLGTRSIEAVGALSCTSWGSPSFSCLMLAVDGVILSPRAEYYLYARQVSESLDRLRMEIDEQLRCRSFIDEVELGRDGMISFHGMVLAGIVDCIDGLDERRRKRKGDMARYGGSLLLNIYR